MLAGLSFVVRAFVVRDLCVRDSRVLGRAIIALAHDAAKSCYQLRSGAAEFLVMMQREFGEHLFSLGSKRKQHFATIILCPGAVDKSSRFQAIHQFHGAVVADLHAIGQIADSRTQSGRYAFDRQHQLVLAPLQTGFFDCFLTEVEKPPDLKPELGQCLIIRQGEPFHVADCIVPRSTSFNIISYNDILQIGKF